MEATVGDVCVDCGGVGGRHYEDCRRWERIRNDNAREPIPISRGLITDTREQLAIRSLVFFVAPPLDVACPSCKAARGAQCTLGGKAKATPHRRRSEASDVTFGRGGGS